MSDALPAISPNDQMFVNMVTDGRAGIPATMTPPAAPPAGDPAAPAATPPAATPAAVTPPALPAPKPAPGFEMLGPAAAPAPDPVQRIADAVASRMPQPAAQPAATPEPDYIVDARAAIADSESSPELVRAAKMTLGQYEQLTAFQREVGEREATRAQAEYDRQLAQEEAAIASEKAAITARYNVSDAELLAVENAWERASHQNPGLLNLTFEEACRRAYGDEAWEARRKGFTPALVPGAPPAARPAVGPQNGHLVGDAAGGGAPPQHRVYATPDGQRPHLTHAYNQAKAALNGA